MTDKPDLYELAISLVRSREKMRRTQEACNDACNDHAMFQVRWANAVYSGNLLDMMPMVCRVDGELYVIYGDGCPMKATEVTHE